MSNDWSRKLEDEADEFRVSLTEFDRLNGCIEWIDLSVVERERTPEWAIQWCIMLPCLSSQVGL